MKITVRAAIAVFLLDQISKYLVVHWLGLASRGSVDVFPPFLNFRMAWNRGINFGLGGDAVSPWILILGFDNPYSFNVADITVFAGAIGLILFAPDQETPKNTP